MQDEILPAFGTKYHVRGTLYKVTGYVVAQPHTLIILDPMVPTLQTKRLRVRAWELAMVPPVINNTVIP